MPCCAWKEGERETEEERCLGSQKTTLSKEGFKDYQLRLLGNLRSCILSTSKRPLCAGILQVGVKGVGGRRRLSTRGESDFSNKCWHQTCLILDSGNSLICYCLWNSSDVLQSGRLATTAPWEQARGAESARLPGQAGSCRWPLKCCRLGVLLSDFLPVSLLGLFLFTFNMPSTTQCTLKKHFKDLRSLIFAEDSSLEVAQWLYWGSGLKGNKDLLL